MLGEGPARGDVGWLWYWEKSGLFWELADDGPGMGDPGRLRWGEPWG